MWANLKRLCGLHPTKHIHAIYNPLTQDTYTCPSEIPNTFGELWSQEAKDTNFSDSFRTNKLLLNISTNYIPSPPLLWTASPIPLNYFSNILNTHIPQAYKVSLVLPILKPQKPQIELKSYRPISLNPCISKILDKIIAKRLWWFALTNKLIHNNQFGLKNGKSVLDHLATR